MGVTVKVIFKDNFVYKILARSSALFGSKRLATYFTNKWARSMKYKVGSNPWAYIDRNAVINLD